MIILLQIKNLDDTIERVSQNVFLETSAWIYRMLGINPGIQKSIIASFLLLTLLFFLHKVALRMMYRYTDHNNVRKTYRLRSAITYFFYVLGFLLIGRIWFIGIDSIATYLGLLSAGIAIALQVPIVNLAGWLFILVRRPFELGDRIQIGEHIGDVVDINGFQFTLNEIGNWVDAEQSTGRLLDIPNGRVFSDIFANYTKGFRYIWAEMPILITFESDWKLAKRLLTEIIEKHYTEFAPQAGTEVKKAARKFLIYYNNLTPIVYTDVLDSGVNLTIRYLVNPRRRRYSREVIWEEVLTAFAKHDNIELAYPTYRIVKE